MRSLLVVALLTLCACATGGAKNKKDGTKNDAELKAIAGWEDRRSLGDGRLMQDAVTSADPLVRRRALLALGRIQDPNTAGAIVEALTDPEAAVRSEAAFAVGLMGLSWAPLSDAVKGRLTAGLLAREAEEQDPAAQLSMLEAMGRVATPPLLERLTDRLTVAGDVQARAALSLGVAARSKTPLPPRAFPALVGLLKKDLPAGVRYGAAYALMQAKQAAPRAALNDCTTDPASEIRALCARGLAEVGTDVDVSALKRLIDDPDYRVSVEATRALAKLSSRCKGPCAAIGALSDVSFRIERLVRGDTAGGGQPLLALAQQGLPAAGKAQLLSLRKQLQPGLAATDPNVRQDVANLDCRMAAALDRIAGKLAEVLTCGAGQIDEARRLSLGLSALQDAMHAGTLDANKAVAEAAGYLLHPDARVKLAAVELLGDLKVAAAQEKVRPLIDSADLIVAAAAASASARLNDQSAIPAIRQLAQRARGAVDVVPTLAEALAVLNAKEATGELEGWLKSPNATVRQSAAEALSTVSGNPVTAERVELPAPKQAPAAAPANARLLVKTKKGEFEIALFTDDAPQTAASLVALARRGFFKNLTFHRVVPDFVVQGGDPRGDGNGGPGYSIRCEVNRRSYARGVVGMALSGKDTGGSQFFVTAAPQPHLDGRYTALGEVTRGQEVVDALLEGDVMLDVVLLTR